MKKFRLFLIMFIIVLSKNLLFAQSNNYFAPTSPVNSTGSNNTFVGIDAGLSNTSGQQNTLIGKDAGKSSTTGGNNVFIGTNSGKNH